MSDWIDQNTFMSSDGKVVRNGFYRDSGGVLHAYFGPKPLNPPPSQSQVNAPPLQSRPEPDMRLSQNLPRADSSSDGLSPRVSLVVIITCAIIWGAFTVVTWVGNRMGVSAQVHEVKMNADEISKLLDSK